MHRAGRLALGFSLAAFAAACAGRPDLPPAPDAYVAGQALGPEAAAALATAPEAAWVAGLATEEVSSFVREALLANPDLGVATERARAARWRARGAFGGNLLPNISLGLGGSRQETPDPAGGRIRTDLMTSEAVASWEVDLWGRLSARTRAADLDADALEADLYGARLSVAGQTAQAWVGLVEATQNLALAREDLETRNRALDITQRRYERGVSDSLALRTARSQSASARAAEAQAADALLIAARRLQELLGRYPDGALAPGAALPALDALDAAGAPRDLLERRPDVLAAEARLRAAGFRAHEARAALLPRLTITARADGSGQGLTDIVDSRDLITNVIGGLTAPIFNGGALLSESRASEADRRAAASDYVSAALAAWREVEAAISADASLAVREAELDNAVIEAREAQDLAEREYGRGVATIFELIDAYTRRIEAERGLISARTARVSNRIAFHVAVGGGGETGGMRTASDDETTP
jgi:NodT family efflux transporter outer membrane factor (OMF) lipoprotein